MFITSKGRYALRAALALAEMGKDGAVVSINTLSEAEEYPLSFWNRFFLS